MNGKKVMIIGASSGIGRSLAEVFLQHHNLTGIAARRKALLEELAARYPGECIAQPLDVTATAMLKTHLRQLSERMNGVDIVVICAGGGKVNETLDRVVEQHTIDLNVSGFTAVAGWAFRQFERQGHGQLVAITSIAGLRGNRQSPGYGAAKAFQINYLQGLRQKAHTSAADITVTDIRPGFVNTPTAQSPVKFWEAPVEKAARHIYTAIIRKRKVAYITRRWRIAAWLFRSLPGWLHERL